MDRIKYLVVSLTICMFFTSGVFATDFLISDMGPDSQTNFSGVEPSVAYNSTDDQYMVVWWGDDDAATANNEFEIFGQCIVTDTGASVLTDNLRISSMGTVGGTDGFNGLYPAIAYNSTENEYLVVWWGDDDRDFGDGALIGDDFEVFGQIINADDCTLKGTNFTISDMGGTGVGVFGVDTTHESAPAVAYNSTDNEYLVAWHGDPVTSGEIEIFGQILNGDGTEKVDDFRISSTPGANLAAVSPAAAYNPDDGQYLVVWWGDFDTNNDFEVYGQLVDADTDGTGVSGSQLLRISSMGGAANLTFIGRFPDVAYNTIDQEYLVVWEGDDTGADDEFEIFGTILNADGSEKVATYKISEMGFADSTDADFGVRHDGTPGPTEDTGPAVVYNAINNEYLVVWEADDDENSLIDNEYEIYGQRLAGGTGAAVDGDSDFRISDMGTTDGSTAFTATYPAVAFDSTADVYLTVWHGDDDTAPQIDDEEEIWGEFNSASTTFRITDTSDVSVAEDSGTLQLSVERIGDLSGAVSVGFTITGASASDYTDLSTTVSFADTIGTAQTVDVVDIEDDTVDENDETITIALASASTGTKIAVTNNSVAVTITDNDSSSGGGGSGGGSGSDDTSGGGGCSLVSANEFDPVFPLIIALTAWYFVRRKIIH
ncbi:MAG: hypothetical protein GY807_04785 [Gammaproteobacteria bacterium]|nr:hypothetical protein [Gammaproteobacteria bacterium]